MEITVKQLSEHSGVGKRNILNYLSNNNVKKLSKLGVQSWKMVGTQYVLVMSKDFTLDNND